jgi:pilus assembly protein CpaE
MNPTIKTLVALDAGVSRDAVEAVIPVRPSIDVVQIVDGLEAGWEMLSRQPVDAVVVACAGTGERAGEYALSFVDGIARDFPDRPVILLSDIAASSALVGRAFAAGAEDVITLPASNGQPPAPAARERVSAELVVALEKAIARRNRAASAPRTGHARMVTVLGPKGGAGKTLVSCNLAVALGEAKKRVVLVDLDLQFGDVGLALGLPPGKTIHELVMSGGGLDAEKLSAYLAPHESGARALLAPSRPDQAAAVSVGFLRELFEVLRASEEFVIVDTPPGFTPEVIAAIDASDDICVVGMLDALSLKNTKLGLETLDLMGVEPERIKLVLNRADSRVGITREDVQAVTGRPPDTFVPSHRDIPRSVNEARPIVGSHPSSDAARSLRGLAESYVGADSAAMNGRKRLLGRWL